MKCLVTGGAGFIGSHIADKLVKLDHQVAVLDNFRTGKRENLNPQAKLYQVDICDNKALENAINDFNPEAIFHLAAQNDVPTSMKNPFEDQQINIIGMMNLLEVAKEKKIKIIYSNTGGAFYGEVAESALPLVEDYPVKKPTSFYGVSKQAAELYLRLYGNIFQIPWVSLRYANVYGPRQDGNKEAGVVAIFTTRLLNKEAPTINGDGLHTRDYVFIEDVVSANITALEYPQSDAFNISTEIGTPTKEVFATIENELKTGISPIYGPNRPGDTRHSTLSFQKARSLLGWSPQFDFQSGIKKTLDFYLKKPL